jgi:hypothetical protein
MVVRKRWVIPIAALCAVEPFLGALTISLISVRPEILSLDPLLQDSALSVRYGNVETVPSGICFTSDPSALYPWVKMDIPGEAIDLSEYQTVSADIINAGSTNVTAALWVCSLDGWQPINHTLTLAPGQTATFNVNLRLAWSGGVPQLNPRRVSHLQLVLNRPVDGSTVILSSLRASGRPAVPFAIPEGRLIVPEVTDGLPFPGSRVKEKLPAYGNTELYHVLYLPKDWQPGRSYPVIVEYSGNEWYGSCYSTGRPEDTRMGYGMSKGEGFIWVSAPCVNSARNAVQETWWDADATADYAVELVRWLCEQYGGDPASVFLTGFSRGGFACTQIGLLNERAADVWLAFHPCQGYEATAQALQDRMPLIRGRATFHTDNDNAGTRSMFEPFGYPVQWANSGLGYHSDVMFLDDRPSTLALRQWMQDVLVNRPGTYTLSGTVTDRSGGAMSGVLMESRTRFTYTDAAGHYELKGIIGGSRPVTATKEGFFFEPVFVTVAGTNLNAINFTETTLPVEVRPEADYEAAIASPADAGGGPELWYKNATSISGTTVTNSGSAGATYTVAGLGAFKYTDLWGTTNKAFGISNPANQSLAASAASDSGSTVSSSTGKFMTGQKGTISLLFKTPTTMGQTATTLFYQGGFELMIQGAGKDTPRLTTAGSIYTYLPKVTADTWYYFAACWNADQGAGADELTWYLGKADGTGTLTNGSINIVATTNGASGTLYLAGHGSYFEYYGAMQEVAVWGRELSEASIINQFDAIQ